MSTLCLLASVQVGAGAAVMSIDLGSEWIKVWLTEKQIFPTINRRKIDQYRKMSLSPIAQVGLIAPNVSMDIAYNKESKRKTPAIIAFHEGERFFGDDAATVGLRFPSKSFHHLTDLLGKSIDNPVVQLYRKRFPYYDIEADTERNTILFNADGIKYSVEELIAQMLQKASEFTIEPARKCCT